MYLLGITSFWLQWSYLNPLPSSFSTKLISGGPPPSQTGIFSNMSWLKSKILSCLFANTKANLGINITKRAAILCILVTFDDWRLLGGLCWWRTEWTNATTYSLLSSAIDAQSSTVTTLLKIRRKVLKKCRKARVKLKQIKQKIWISNQEANNFLRRRFFEVFTTLKYQMVAMIF